MLRCKWKRDRKGQYCGLFLHAVDPSSLEMLGQRGCDEACREKGGTMAANQDRALLRVFAAHRPYVDINETEPADERNDAYIANAYNALGLILITGHHHNIEIQYAILVSSSITICRTTH